MGKDPTEVPAADVTGSRVESRKKVERGGIEVPRVIHFEIQADRPTRAQSFYESVFGWTFRKWEGPIDYWHITTGPENEAGINGGMIRRPEPPSSGGVTAYVCTVRVENLDETLVRVRDSRGKVVQPPFPIPGIGWMAYCQDSEGNHFGLIRHDPSA